MEDSKTITGVKILIIGDVRGNFIEVFKKFKKLKKKGFQAAFCVGTFFDPRAENKQLEPYLSGKTAIEIPTYFITSDTDKKSHALFKNSKQLCSNLTYLGQSGITTIAGLTIGHLSGVYNTDYYNNHDRSEAAEVGRYSSHDVDELLDQQSLQYPHGLDILLTSEWGRGFHRFLDAEDIPVTASGLCKSIGSPAVSMLASELAVRYHFASLEQCFFQLPPFRNRTGLVSRFYGLGSVANSFGMKFLQALNVTPINQVNREGETNIATTANP